MMRTSKERWDQEKAKRREGSGGKTSESFVALRVLRGESFCARVLCSTDLTRELKAAANDTRINVVAIALIRLRLRNIFRWRYSGQKVYVGSDLLAYDAPYWGRSVYGIRSSGSG